MYYTIMNETIGRHITLYSRFIQVSVVIIIKDFITSFKCIDISISIKIHFYYVLYLNLNLNWVITNS